jgi:hypothetical protein
MIMRKKIYVQLLNEGTISFRPVLAVELGENLYNVEGDDIYNPEDEEWEFLPGAVVLVEEQMHSEGAVLVAIKEIVQD